ncbi:MAG: fatty acid desaturase [Actinomycetota bacterium]|nr:fatty acid desaturase [Actinomycetota bacterium]
MGPRTGTDRLMYERSIVEPHVGSIGWRSLFNITWCVLGWVSIVALRTAEMIPLWAAVLLAALFLQACYMPMHESVHKTLSAGRPALRWVDRSVGALAGWLLCESFSAHSITHLKHHTHTNDETDPDVLNSKGSPRDILFRVIIGMILYPLGPVFAAIPPTRRLLPKGLAARLGQMAQLRGPEAIAAGKPVVIGHVTVLVLGSILGYAETVWLLWYVPAWIGRFWLSLVFGWLPHHPHSETGRYRDTRVFTFFGSTFLIRGHDYHLLHHLFPIVPHYRLRRLWRDIGHHLADQGARIEGRAAKRLQFAENTGSRTN